ncbi:MAG: 4Fe-4S binding protein [Ignavibacteriales bacterium]|nr:4Fe-4S binding protein [Ignavibacteriales bacterium]
MIEILPDKCDFCGCCVGVCPEDAIELKEAEIFIIDERCTNCSKCVWSCPIEVIKFVIKNGFLFEKSFQMKKMAALPGDPCAHFV